MGAEYGGGSGLPREYFNIVSGKLVKSAAEAEALDPRTRDLLPAYQYRQNKKGAMVYEKIAKYGISGNLTRIEFNDGSFGKELELGIQDDGKEFVVTIQAVNQARNFTDYAKSLIIQLPLVDFTKPIKVNTWHRVGDNGKDYYGIVVFQHLGDNDWASMKQLDEDALKASKEDIPMGEEKDDGTGGTMWDFTKARVALFKKLDQEIKRFVETAPTLPPPQTTDGPAEPEPAMAEADAQAQAEDDDLPF